MLDVLIGLLKIEYAYTGTTFISLGILLMIIGATKKEFMTNFYITFIVITCIPFLIVNGILTGFLEKESPVVWYNAEEMLNIRIWTIPLEDFFYSMLLLLSNIYMFEIFEKKQ